jgi:alkylation response protein AidB-like acyl-CoA dehydrogenase
MSLWFVPRETPGISSGGEFNGLGLRGNGSTPVVAADAAIPRQALLGEDGAGLDLALTAEAGDHLRTTRLEHLEQSLAEQPLERLDHARMRVTTDQAAALLTDTLNALGAGRADAMLRVLEVKAAAGEAALAVTTLGMKVGGGAAFRKELGIERRHRDALAARVMAPTTDALLDFIGRAINGLPLL